VGAVILTNSESGPALRGPFARRILELMFDGRPQAEADVAAAAKSYFNDIAATRKLLTVPADPTEAGKLAGTYASGPLGGLTVTHPGGATVFDFGEWKTDMATRKEPDGSTTLVSITPGIDGLEFVPGSGAKRTLTIRDAQHEYVFTER
ncbi:MAG TPA: serine hydrolase, partial [Thermoanaerobaculia bacterium]|nr:serine hydrolase [Thermoanaerobaculia bacterium]